jgi:AP-2 complex subunit sigma-1
VYISNARAAVLQYRNYKVVYRRYAGLFFCLCVDSNDNELAYLEAIHLFVEVLGEFRLLPR